MDSKTFQILIVDNHPVVLAGIEAIAGNMEDVSCTGITQVKQLDVLLQTRSFDLCIVDLELSDSNGFNLIERLRSDCPECRILVYTMHEEPWIQAQLTGLNIQGAVSKNSEIAELRKAIQTLRSGGVYFDTTFQTILKGKGGNEQPRSILLSEREKQILTCLSQGMTTSQIAQHLFISTNTVQTYRKRLLAKLEAKNVAELVRKGKFWAV